MSISRCLSEKQLKYILDEMDLFVSSGKSYIGLLLQSQSELKLWQARMGLLRASAVQCSTVQCNVWKVEIQKREQEQAEETVDFWRNFAKIVWSGFCPKRWLPSSGPYNLE